MLNLLLFIFYNFIKVMMNSLFDILAFIAPLRFIKKGSV